MNLFIPKYLLLLLCVMFCSTAMAQEDLDKATALMLRVKDTYDSANISFHAKYTYSDADKPGQVTDSLQGDGRIAGTNSYMSLGSIIFFKNQSYSISIFKDDKLMMLSRPSELDKNMQMPSDFIAGLLKKAGMEHCTVRHYKRTTTIVFEYSDTAPYKESQMTIDDATMLITSLSIKVRKPAAPDDTVTADNMPVQYVVVNMVFSDLKKEKNNPSAFDEKVFFTRTGNVFKPAAAYSEYQVFIATPNI